MQSKRKIDPYSCLVYLQKTNRRILCVYHLGSSVQVVALYPFQAIESGDISLEKVIELGTHIFLVGPVIPLSSPNDALSFVVQKGMFNCVFFHLG